MRRRSCTGILRTTFSVLNTGYSEEYFIIIFISYNVYIRTQQCTFSNEFIHKETYLVLTVLSLKGTLFIYKIRVAFSTTMQYISSQDSTKAMKLFFAQLFILVIRRILYNTRVNFFTTKKVRVENIKTRIFTFSDYVCTKLGPLFYDKK